MCFTDKRKRNWIRKEDRVPNQVRHPGQVLYGGAGCHNGSRLAGPGIVAIGNPYRGRQRRMTPYNEDSFSASFESMSVGTQFSDSLNDGNIFPPYTMSYGQPSHPSGSISEEYEMINHPYDPQMSFQISYQMQQGF